MDDQLNNYIDKCRCCLEEITFEKVEINGNIENKYYEITQLNLASSNLLPSFICVNCYEILNSYSAIRLNWICNHQRLEQLLLSQCEFTTENEYTVEEGDEEEEESCVEYEEIEVRVESGDVQEIIMHEIVKEDEEVIQEQPDNSNQAQQEEEEDDESDEDDLKLEDIIKPEFLHYCLPKKDSNQKKSNSLKTKNLAKDKIDKSLMCEECGKLFSNPVAVKQHILLIHRNIRFKCDAENCERVFTTELHLIKHIAAFHKNTTKIPCHVCNKLFKNENDLNIHMNTMHAEGYDEEFKCEICSQVLISYKVYQNHVKKHREGKFKCELCDKKFQQKIHLSNHMKFHKNNFNV